MKLTCGGFGRIILITVAPLAFFACSNVPLGQSTSEMSSPSAVNTAPSVVMPVALPGNPTPTYPEAVLKDGQSGVVTVTCLVNEKGEVVQALIQNSTHPAFNETTLNAVRRWRFQPGTRDGVPAPVMISVPVEFAAQRVAGP